ncbi:ComEC/Rec2 family competence protein [Fusibacter bizertensis]
MKRGFLFLVVIITIFMYTYMNDQYYQTVSLAKENFKSNQKLSESIVTIEGRILDGNINDDGFIAQIDKVNGDSVNFKWRLYRYKSDVSAEVDLSHSSFIATINLNQIQFSSAKNNSGFDYDKYLYANGVTKQFKLLSIHSFNDNSHFSFLKYRFAVLHRINFIIDSTLSDGTKSMIKALILGEKSEFENYELYKELGLAHLFAISGLHFGILFYFLKKVFSFLPYGFSSILCFLFLLILLIIVGWPYSAQRAFFIICYNELNQLLGKKKDVYMSIAFSLMLILILQPHAILSTSLHLSYYAYISITIIFPQFNKNKHKNKLIESVRFSFLIQIILLPASLYYFQKFNLYSFISNFIMVPLIGILLPISFLFIIFALIGIKSILIASLLELLVTLMNYISNLLPLKTSAFVAFKQTDFAVMVLILLLFFLCHTIWQLYEKKRIILITAALLFISFFVANELSVYNSLKIITFDVGHGDMTLLQTRTYKVLVDTGDGKNNCEALLRGEGIHSLDALVISHAHNDHYGGAVDLINHMKIKYLIVNEDTYQILKDEISNIQTEIIIVKKQALSIHDLKRPNKIDSSPSKIDVDILPILGDNYLTDPNENALIVRFKVQKNLGYLLGDITKEMISTLKDLNQITFVKSAHHGSKTSLSPELYNNGQIEVVVTSCNTKYSMPNEAFENLLENNKITHMTTYASGEIIVFFKQSAITISTVLNMHNHNR